MKNYTLDEIRAIILGRGTKESKIAALCEDEQINARTAERIYNQVRTAAGLSTDAPRAARRRAVRAARHHFTMGIEIEAANINQLAISDGLRAAGIESIRTGYDHRDQQRAYKLAYDGSLSASRGDSYGTCEIVSPILRNLDTLREVCRVINENGGHANRTCGLHVHIGAQGFTPAIWRRMVINYARIEAAIDSVMAVSRRGDCRWAKGMGNAARYLEPRTEPTMSDIYASVCRDRYYKVNVMTCEHGHNTIEFRQHGGTTNFAKIEAWVKFLCAFVAYSIDHAELLEATDDITALPFLNATQKRWFSARRAALASRVDSESDR